MFLPMKVWSRKNRWVVGCLCGLPLVAVIGLFAEGLLNPFGRHQHCMKGTGLTFLHYAGEHGGRFPFHTNGFGDAIVTLLKELPDDPRLFTAPGDDGTLLSKFMESGGNVPEERCTRAYVQGLSEGSNPEIALIFDRYPTRGGDHSRSPWRTKLREVWMLGSGLKIIKERDWPEFARKQIELLVAEGITRSEAEEYYRPPAR